MTFKSKHWKDGDKRTRRIFALMPLTIVGDDVIETRWLCWVNVEEQYHDGYMSDEWDVIRFID